MRLKGRLGRTLVELMMHQELRQQHDKQMSKVKKLLEKIENTFGVVYKEKNQYSLNDYDELPFSKQLDRFIYFCDFLRLLESELMRAIGSFDQHLKFKYITREGFFKDLQCEILYVQTNDAKFYQEEQIIPMTLGIPNHLLAEHGIDCQELLLSSLESQIQLHEAFTDKEDVRQIILDYKHQYNQFQIRYTCVNDEKKDPAEEMMADYLVYRYTSSSEENKDDEEIQEENKRNKMINEHDNYFSMFEQKENDSIQNQQIQKQSQRQRLNSQQQTQKYSFGKSFNISLTSTLKKNLENELLNAGCEINSPTNFLKQKLEFLNDEKNSELNLQQKSEITQKEDISRHQKITSDQQRSNDDYVEIIDSQSQNEGKVDSNKSSNFQNSENIQTDENQFQKFLREIQKNLKEYEIRLTKILLDKTNEFKFLNEYQVGVYQQIYLEKIQYKDLFNDEEYINSGNFKILVFQQICKKHFNRDIKNIELYTAEENNQANQISEYLIQEINKHSNNFANKFVEQKKKDDLQRVSDLREREKQQEKFYFNNLDLLFSSQNTIQNKYEAQQQQQILNEQNVEELKNSEQKEILNTEQKRILNMPVAKRIADSSYINAFSQLDYWSKQDAENQYVCVNNDKYFNDFDIEMHTNNFKLYFQDVEIKKDEYIFDVCCGNGRLIPAYVQYFNQGNVCLQDGTPKFLKKAIDIYKELTGNEPQHSFDNWLQGLKFPYKIQFKAILCSYALQNLNLDELKDFILKCERQMMKGGYIFIKDSFEKMMTDEVNGYAYDLYGGVFCKHWEQFDSLFDIKKWTPELKDFKAWEENLDVYFVYKRL